MTDETTICGGCGLDFGSVFELRRHQAPHDGAGCPSPAPGGEPVDRQAVLDAVERPEA